MNLSGCDKVVLKNSISGSRFIVSRRRRTAFFRSSPSQIAFVDVIPNVLFFFSIWAIMTCRNSPNFTLREFTYVTADSQSDASVAWRASYVGLLFMPLSDSLAYYRRLNDSAAYVHGLRRLCAPLTNLFDYSCASLCQVDFQDQRWDQQEGWEKRAVQ